MKFLVLFLVAAVLSASCFKTTNQTASENEILQAEVKNLSPILEIQQEAQGLWDVTGKTLFFRLYENGTVEFEQTGAKKITPGKINKAEETNTLKRVKLSEDELQKFLLLLDSEDFQTAENYRRKCCCTDAFLNYKLFFKFNNKQTNITFHNYCDAAELKSPQARNISGIPKVLSDLMTLVDVCRWKYISP